MKTKLFFATIALFFSMQLFAQEKTLTDLKTTSDIKSDSTTLGLYNQKKDEVVKQIVQIQSTIYESQEQLKDAYNKLSQLNIAIDLLEQKIKLYNNQTYMGADEITTGTVKRDEIQNAKNQEKEK